MCPRAYEINNPQEGKGRVQGRTKVTAREEAKQMIPGMILRLPNVSIHPIQHLRQTMREKVEPVSYFLSSKEQRNGRGLRAILFSFQEGCAAPRGHKLIKTTVTHYHHGYTNHTNHSSPAANLRHSMQRTRHSIRLRLLEDQEIGLRRTTCPG